MSQGQAIVVRFPKEWTELVDGREQFLAAPLGYEIRSAAAVTRAAERPTELMFSAMTAKGYWGEIYANKTGEKPAANGYSVNSYVVDLKEGVHVREGRREEWTRASRVSMKPQRLFPRTPAEAMEDAFEYHGLTFRKSGEQWGTVNLSPGGKWIAVISYSGKNSPVIVSSGGVPREGDVYWDVYDAATGKKVLSWSAKSVANPALLGANVSWVGEEYVVMPLEADLRDCVIGTLPKR